jgi:hypothetical protein
MDLVRLCWEEEISNKSSSFLDGLQRTAAAEEPQVCCQDEKRKTGAMFALMIN